MSNPAFYWKPGQSGNPGGRPSHKAWREALQAAVLIEDKRTKKIRLDIIAEKCVQLAMLGDPDARKEIGDRLDGKPAITMNANINYPLFEQAIAAPAAAHVVGQAAVEVIEHSEIADWDLDKSLAVKSGDAT